MRTANVASSPTTICSGATAANYSFSYTGGTVTIQRATVTVTASSPVVTYGDAVPAITPSYSAFQNSDTASVISGQSCSTVYEVTSAVVTTPATSREARAKWPNPVPRS